MLWGTLAVSALAVLGLDDGEPVEERIAFAAGFLALGVLVMWTLGGLTVRLYPDAMVVGLGRASPIRTRIAYEQISSLEVTRYSPLREFGGWGYRFRPGKRAWTARGDEAVVLHMADGMQIYIGSDRPGRLRERILAVGGTRIGSRRGS